jgi:hypothetical protein
MPYVRVLYYAEGTADSRVPRLAERSTSAANPMDSGARRRFTKLLGVDTGILLELSHTK